MGFVRDPAVAGLFYPAERDVLAHDVRALLDQARARAATIPKAVIAPHAGYVYSGPIAANVYARLAAGRHGISSVVLIGPSHRVAYQGIALSSAEAFETPLGRIPLDREAIARLCELPGVGIFDAAHVDEHSLEVHLPFLQIALEHFSLVPMVAGDADPDMVAAALEAVWGGPETLIVISSDLSHYLDYASARTVDERTRKAIENLDPAALSYDQACGRVPISGLLTLAKRRGLAVETIDLRNSGDTAGPRDRVVGYGAWLFTETAPAAARPSDEHAQGRMLLSVARAAIEAHLAGQPAPPLPADLPAALLADGACFVSLKRQGHLRGCVGSSTAWQALAADVADNAVRAAFQDPRFPPLDQGELADLDVSLSILTPPQALVFADEVELLAQLRPHVDGLIIEDGPNRALFLPVVWEQLPHPGSFLGHLKAKAGLPPDYWSPTLRAFRFTAVEVK